MKRLFILLATSIMCGCSQCGDELDIDVYDTDAYGHSYLIFESRSGDIEVIHHPDCETCKNKINGEPHK